jgi:UDP-glucose 4-epimerase
MPSTVLITGVGRFMGGRLAALLAADPSIDRVIGIDTVPPTDADRPLLGRTEFVHADLRNPLTAKVIAQARATTIVHTGAGDSGGRGQEPNVIATMHLVAAAQQSDLLERFVLCSSTAVYGNGRGDPGVLVEDSEIRSTGGGPRAKDAAEIESAVRAFARRRPDVCTTVLRMAQPTGLGADSSFSRYLAAPVVPTVLGFDPRLQLLHAADAIEAMRLATVSTRPGVVNVAADGVVTLSQLLRRTGRIRLAVPGPAFSAVGAAVSNHAAAALAIEDPAWLRHGRVVDTQRLRETFGYRPRFSTDEVIDTLTRVANPLPRVAAGLVDVGSGLLAGRRTRRQFAIDST